MPATPQFSPERESLPLPGEWHRPLYAPRHPVSLLLLATAAGRVSIGCAESARPRFSEDPSEPPSQILLLPPSSIRNWPQEQLRRLSPRRQKNGNKTTASFHRTQFLQVDKRIFALVLRIQKFSPNSL